MLLQRLKHERMLDILKVLAIIGLVCAVFTFLTKIELSTHFDTPENAGKIVSGVCAVILAAMLYKDKATETA